MSADEPAWRATYAKALDALARRARSSAELTRWLAQRDHSPEHVARTIERLPAGGLLDDAPYGPPFAPSRAARRGAGAAKRRRALATLAPDVRRRRLYRFLARRGYAQDRVRETVAKLTAS